METGTIIHGTLLNYDLIEAFVTELEARSVGSNDAEVKSLIIEANEVCALGMRDGKDAVNYPADDAAADYYGWLITDLSDKLDELAPEGYYFGAHPGDGADFGYWPIEQPC